jgi:non-ribosomal peptide synthetase component E (peptide arylation enzyme)
MDFDIKFVDPLREAVPDGTEDEILARGPAQFLGYADPKETLSAMTPDGFFCTGDLGYRTPEGAIVISGRKKDLIIRGGENISAKEIEDVLLRHPAVRDVAVVSMPHERSGETVCAFVIPGGEPPQLASLVQHLEGYRLAKQKYPEHLEIADDFPRTPAGKVRKNVLRQMIADKVKGARE